MFEKDYPSSLQPNVVDGEELRTLFDTVFSQMAKYVSRTYGPFGENTAYQEGGRLLTTKDGWSVEQSIIYQKSVLAAVVRKMIIDVSTAINMKAGDGTSTGLIAANEIHQLLMDYKKTHHIHSKFLSNTIEYCVEKICEELRNSSWKITDENLEETIYQIALVSLDWDKEAAGFIRDIYKETRNPIIKVQDSGTESSFIEIRDGYDMSAKLISEFKVNNLGEKKYTSDRPAIMIFSYTMNAGMFEPLMMAASAIGTVLNRELFVLAPNFEKDFRDAYNQTCIKSSKMNVPLPNLVMVRYNAEFNIEREMLIDFSFLTGAIINARENNEVEEILREFVEAMKQPVPNVKTYDNDEAYQDDMKTYRDNVRENMELFTKKMADGYLGVCDTISVTDKNIVVSGFGDIEQSDALQNRINTIQAEIDKLAKDMNAKSMVNEEVGLKTIRLGKLKLKMGIINVGGFGEGQLRAKKDALDDAIKACEKAYIGGVTYGGGIAIPLACENLKTMMDNGNWNPEEEKGMDNQLVMDILRIFYVGFYNTIAIMVRNRYPSDFVDITNMTDDIKNTLIEQEAQRIETYQHYESIKKAMVDNLDSEVSIESLVDEILERQCPWNLITEKFDDSIIHPVTVETEIIKGVLNLVLTTTTVNQLLFSSYEGAEKELEGLREVK